MSEFLGIAVFTDKFFDHVVELAKAAKRAGKTVKVFISGEGVKTVKNPRFKELLEAADPENVFICEASYRRYVGENMEKLKKQESPVEGVPYKNWVTQAKNAEFLKDCDRYINF